jgi:hypothetical protein
MIWSQGFSNVGYNVTANADMSLNFDSPGFDVIATYQSDEGRAAFGITSFSTDVPVGGVYSTSGMQSFEYLSKTDVPTSDPTDHLLADITWTTLVIAPNAEWVLDGVGMVTGSSGDAAFVNDFPVGGLFSVDTNLPTLACTGIDLPFTGCMPDLTLVYFEIGTASPLGLPPPPPPPPPLIDAPEPMTSFTALGIALFGLWGAYQFSRRERLGSPF